MEIVYFTCLNNECEKHRNIFMEGDPQHANCARERLWLEGQRPSMPTWAWFALPVALLPTAAGVAFFVRSQRATPKRPLHDERKTQHWSHEHRHIDERRGSSVPPPIS